MGILLVYDVTDESSFNNIRNWIRNIEQHASDNVNKILVGRRALGRGVASCCGRGILGSLALSSRVCVRVGGLWLSAGGEVERRRMVLEDYLKVSWWALMPGDEESMTDEAIWETLPHFWVAVSMVFFLAATMFTLLKLSGDDGALGWWDLFINFGIAECFSFLVCTKWSNPTIQRDDVFHAGSGGHSSVSPPISMSSVIHDAAHGSSSANDEDDGSDGSALYAAWGHASQG
ncbi:hypothetical protein AXG93_1463s1000 [Marchantia polymorpha subsp. ruderalis]|uniref:Uncharacterized protein n=1 Tax=Marchantia polymorpha subsp. ruderalis TaxID=1480154 RepID=A0A176WMU0_MARPO|nr:hypothetical protein AXG93_1463s1000 [Marchantia polymorpha subsp. ruderalis]